MQTIKTVLASKVRKGQIIMVDGCYAVRVVKREKWNSKDVKVHYEVAPGFYPPPTDTFNLVGVASRFYKLSDEIILASVKL